MILALTCLQPSPTFCEVTYLFPTAGESSIRLMNIEQRSSQGDNRSALHIPKLVGWCGVKVLFHTMREEETRVHGEDPLTAGHANEQMSHIKCPKTRSEPTIFHCDGYTRMFELYTSRLYTTFSTSLKTQDKAHITLQCSRLRALLSCLAS